MPGHDDFPGGTATSHEVEVEQAGEFEVAVAAAKEAVDRGTEDADVPVEQPLPQAGPSSEPVQAYLRPGQRVQVHGLKKAPQMNGRTGTFSRWNEEDPGWCLVDMDDGEGNQLRAANLVVLEDPSVPRAVVPPRGLSGLLEGHDATATLDTSQFPPGMVLLNVYDLAADVEVFQKINKVTTGNNNALLGGLFHAGVEVYGIEWCYGFTDDGGTGVCPLQPRTHPQHKYRTTVPMGVTAISESDVRVLLERLSAEWPGYMYHLFHCNCLNFSNALCSELGVGRIPGWVDRAARAAAALDTGYRGVASGAQKVRSAIPVDAQDAQAKAGEVLEGVQRRSVMAIGAVQTTASELHEKAMPAFHGFREKALTEVNQTRTYVRQRTSDLVSEDTVSKAQEQAAVIGEKAQAIGASFWSGIRDLQRAASGTIAVAPAPEEEPPRGQGWGFGALFTPPAGSVLEASVGRTYSNLPQEEPVHGRCASRPVTERPSAALPAPTDSASMPRSSDAAEWAQRDTPPGTVALDAAPSAPRSSASGSPGSDLLVSPTALQL